MYCCNNYRHRKHPANGVFIQNIPVAVSCKITPLNIGDELGFCNRFGANNFYDVLG